MDARGTVLSGGNGPSAEYNMRRVWPGGERALLEASWRSLWDRKLKGKGQVTRWTSA